MIEIGLVLLAVGGLLGWGMVVMEDKPQWLKRAGIIEPRRIRQVHLDYVFMGLILIGVGTAVPSLPKPIAIALVFGTIMNPFLFVPQMFSRTVSKRPWYRVLATLSFIAVSGGLVATAICGPG
jgi:hypothetical protein